MSLPALSCCDEELGDRRRFEQGAALFFAFLPHGFCGKTSHLSGRDMSNSCHLLP